MKTATAGLILTLALLVAPLVAEAEQANKTYRVGVLMSASSPAVLPPFFQAFRRGLRDLGWIEGQNITIEWRFAEGRYERLPDLAAELVRLKVDLIVAGTAVETRAAQQATKTIPIVFLVHGDPVGTGDVASLARPGGNITGLSAMLPELTAKRLELLKEAIPSISRVAVLWNAANPITALDWKEAQVAARALGVTLQSREVRGPNDFESAFGAMTRERSDALMTLDDPLTFRYRTQIVDFAAKERLPAMYAFRESVEAGGLMAYGVNVADVFRRGAGYVDKILKGAKPGALPVEQPTKFELVINMKTAKALGLTIPQSMFIRADEIIQ